MITGRRADALESAVLRLKRDSRGDAGWIVHDMSAPDSAEAVIADAAARFGGPDVLVLNAGGPPPGRILDVGDEGWLNAFRLLLLGPLAMARAALPRMSAGGFGRVVFVTSAAVRQPEPDLATSVVLRSAVTAAAKLLSRECAAGRSWPTGLGPRVRPTTSSTAPTPRASRPGGRRGLKRSRRPLHSSSRRRRVTSTGP